MTKKVLEKLTCVQRTAVEEYKKEYKKRSENITLLHEATWAAISYLCGLRDAGAITDREKQILYCYITV